MAPLPPTDDVIEIQSAADGDGSSDGSNGPFGALGDAGGVALLVGCNVALIGMLAVCYSYRNTNKAEEATRERTKQQTLFMDDPPNNKDYKDEEEDLAVYDHQDGLYDSARISYLDYSVTDNKEEDHANPQLQLQDEQEDGFARSDAALLGEEGIHNTHNNPILPQPMASMSFDRDYLGDDDTAAVVVVDAGMLEGNAGSSSRGYLIVN